MHNLKECRRVGLSSKLELEIKINNLGVYKVKRTKPINLQRNTDKEQDIKRNSIKTYANGNST